MRFILTLSALLAGLGLYARDNANQEKLRQEASEFSLSVVKTYFDEDCDKYWSFVSDSILLMDEEGTFAKEDKKDKLCSSLKRAIRNKDKTFQDYIDTYKVEILTKEELENKIGEELPSLNRLTDFDFFSITCSYNSMLFTQSFSLQTYMYKFI
ncbi:MAG: hypothetical protein ACK5MG_09825 [Bacteroidales bacterium]